MGETINEWGRRAARSLAWCEKGEGDVVLRLKLDIAVEALKKIPHQGFPDEEDYHPWYPHCPGCIAQEALRKIGE